MAIEPIKKQQSIFSKIVAPAATVAGAAIGSVVPGAGTLAGASLGAALGGAAGGVAKGIADKDVGTAAGGVAQGVAGGASGLDAMSRRLEQTGKVAATAADTPNISPNTAALRDGNDALQGLPQDVQDMYKPTLTAALQNSLRRDFSRMA